MDERPGAWARLALARRMHIPRSMDAPGPHGPPDPGREVVSIANVMTADASLAAAASRICHLNIGCLPVVERTSRGPRLLGVVTESDLLRAAYPVS